jgi:hypothetical protein
LVGSEPRITGVMVNITPQMQRYIDNGIDIEENAQYRDTWTKARNSSAEISDRIVIAILANIAASLEKEIFDKGADMTSEHRIVINNDLWLVSDMIETLIEKINSITA